MCDSYKLTWPPDIHTQLPRNIQHPLRFPQELPSDQNHIGHGLFTVLGIGHLLRCLSFLVDTVLKLGDGAGLLDNVSRLLCFCDHANSADEKLQVIGMHGVPDTVGDLNLVVLGVKPVDTLVRMVAAAADVQQVNAQSRKLFGHLDR